MTDLSKLQYDGMSERDDLIKEIMEKPDRITASVETSRRQRELQEAATRQANRPAELMEAGLEEHLETNQLLKHLLAAQNQTNQLLQEIKDKLK